MAQLPDTGWRRSAGLGAIVDCLRDDQDGPRFVGGAVRDALLGLPVSDIDIATPVTPTEVIARLETAGLRAIPTGIDHGTVTALAGDAKAEITTLRRDVSTDGRHAIVAFSTDWKEDAARRDFTINALYANPASGEVFDYFGGLADLEAGLVRFIGDPAARIAEDHLRILRFFRFHTRFGKGAPDKASLDACIAAAHSLTALSSERLADELFKLLALPNPAQSVSQMLDGGIFSAILPEVDKAGVSALHRLLEREQMAEFAPSALLRLAALLPCDPEITNRVSKRLKLSNTNRAELAALAQHRHPAARKARPLAYRIGTETTRDLFLLRADDSEWKAGLSALRDWTPPVFPIKGGALIERGLAQGKAVSETLRVIEDQWVAEGFPDAARANAIADQLVASALQSARKA
ncbi:MAG: CCA tRNA nucleotidyltransferase [Sphingomonadales bacterium]|uniref:CCA tRNA nucleotidyltransferase n=1 Tax=Sphingorhabdus sp. TaxID=1902408 RepID=UPI003BAF0360|nr:CCA tRNA nucleotidyltransferase [Sphingomonadales bacterium]